MADFLHKALKCLGLVDFQSAGFLLLAVVFLLGNASLLADSDDFYFPQFGNDLFWCVIPGRYGSSSQNSATCMKYSRIHDTVILGGQWRLNAIM